MAGEMHIGAMLRDIAQRHGERTAIVDDAGAWTYGQFVARINRFGNALHGLGLQRGDRVGLLLPDMREYLEADYGAMSAGFVRVPMDPQMTGPQLAQALRHAGARACELSAHGVCCRSVGKSVYEFQNSNGESFRAGLKVLLQFLRSHHRLARS